MRRAIAILLFSVLAACSGPSDPGTDGGTADPFDAYEDVLEFSSGEWTVDPFTESYKCAVVPMENADDFLLNRYRADMLPNSHHFNLLYVPSGGYGPPGLYDGSCQMLNSIPVWFAGSQWQNVDEPLPDATVVTLPANSDLLLDVHYVNTTETPIQGRVDLKFGGLHPDEVEVEMGTYFNFLQNFQVPPQSTQTWGVRYEVLAGSKIHMLTSHSHRRTFKFEIFRYREGSPDLELLYVSENPLEPLIMKMYDDPIVFGENEGFEFRCSWYNDTDTVLRWGESGLTDEMCIMAAFYTPSAGLGWLYGQKDGWIVPE